MFYAFANNKGADQPVHPHSLISACIFRCFDSIMPLAFITKSSRVQLFSVAETWSESPNTGFLVTELIYL